MASTRRSVRIGVAAVGIAITMVVALVTPAAAGTNDEARFDGGQTSMASAQQAGTAAPQAEKLYWIRFAAGVQRCLDANLEGTVYTHACQDLNTYQQWDNYTTGKFRHKRTGRCLAAGVSSVFLGSCSVNASDWTTSSTTNKYIMNKSTGLCLDNDGGQAEPVGLRACRAGTALWFMTRLND